MGQCVSRGGEKKEVWGGGGGGGLESGRYGW
jgi:hypothetical protein